jgi:hypothetical protein
MADYSVTRSKHATLAGGTADSVTFARTFATVVVHNRGTADPIYFTIDDSVPTPGANDSYVVPPGHTKILEDPGVRDVRPGQGISVKVVRLVSAGAMAYSVEGY